MSKKDDDKNLPTIEIAQSDFTQKEARQLKAFVSNGMPGIHSFDLEKQTKAKELYLSGRSYDDISKIFRIKKEVILYLSEKEQWYEEKIAKYHGLALSLKPKITIAQLESKHFLSDLISFTHTYFQDKMQEYARTKNDRVLETMNHKLLEKYFKSIELLYKLEEKDPKPSVNFNLPEGSTIEKLDDNTIQVTPNDEGKKDVAAILKALADLNRARDEK